MWSPVYVANLAKSFQDEKFQKSMAKVLQDVNASGKVLDAMQMYERQKYVYT